ncbi:hypothetical protein CDD82_3152 [Ophiocordyceps australis]|uniref:Uncharacterized protein n=1 Tax=Ophiocordyceps australis TaxID=1399860 RepID=A0A2C5ZEL7_9HYPO|nr:hypothetical protein CDD82_3152 [Ophiocordyceps australis]
MAPWSLPDEEPVCHIDQLVQQRLKHIWDTQSADWSYSVRLDFHKLYSKAHVSYDTRFPSYHLLIKQRRPMSAAAYMILQTTYGASQMLNIKSWRMYRKENKWTSKFMEKGVLPMDTVAWLEGTRPAKYDKMGRAKIKEEDEMSDKTIREEEEVSRKRIKQKDEEMPRKRIKQKDEETPRKKIKKNKDEPTGLSYRDSDTDKKEKIPEINDNKNTQQVAAVRPYTSITAKSEPGVCGTVARQTHDAALPAQPLLLYTETTCKHTSNIANTSNKAETKGSMPIKSEQDAVWSRLTGRREHNVHQHSSRFEALETQVAELKMWVRALEEKERMLEEKTASLAEQKAVLDTLQRRVQTLADYLAPQE